jgi:hypothetical protein
MGIVMVMGTAVGMATAYRILGMGLGTALTTVKPTATDTATSCSTSASPQGEAITTERKHIMKKKQEAVPVSGIALDRLSPELYEEAKVLLYDEDELEFNGSIPVMLDANDLMLIRSLIQKNTQKQTDGTLFAHNVELLQKLAKAAEGRS